MFKSQHRKHGSQWNLRVLQFSKYVRTNNRTAHNMNAGLNHHSSTRTLPSPWYLPEKLSSILNLYRSFACRIGHTNVCGGMLRLTKTVPVLKNALNVIAIVLGLVWHIESQNWLKRLCVWTDMFMLTSITVQLSLKVLVLLSSPYSERMQHPWLLSSPNIYASIAKYISSNKGNKTSYSVCRMLVFIKTAGPQRHRLPIPTKRRIKILQKSSSTIQFPNPKSSM